MEERAKNSNPAPLSPTKNSVRDKKLADALKRNMQRRKLANQTPEVAGAHE